jgi:hypothetical protein
MIINTMNVSDLKLVLGSLYERMAATAASRAFDTSAARTEPMVR